jgi:acetylornithine deacetylase/succinyl-diaminopimelate desuccinylase-like protein
MNYYHDHRAEFLEGLKAFLRIPSISALSEHKTDILRAAEFARAELERAGLDAELIEGQGNPLVYGEWLGAPGKPTILFYGHYDSSPKFAATTSSPAARPTTKARSTCRSKPSRAS